MSYQSVVAADTPVHWWRLSDPGGAIARDYGSSKRILTQTTPNVTFPYTGIAADGGSFFTPGGVTISTIDPLATQVSPYSIEIWYWQAARAARQQNFFAYDGITAGTGFFFTAAGLPTFSGPVNLQSAVPVPIQGWHHFVGTYDEINMRLYVDGAQVAFVANGTHQSFSVNCAIGGTPSVTNTGVGFLAEACIYAGALSAGRVSAHFAAQEVNIPPVYAGQGSVDVTSGGMVPDATNLAAVLASVRKVY